VTVLNEKIVYSAEKLSLMDYKSKNTRTGIKNSNDKPEFSRI
jgi:hypothetical protein